MKDINYKLIEAYKNNDLINYLKSLFAQWSFL